MNKHCLKQLNSNYSIMKQLSFLFLLSVLICFTACKDEDPIDPVDTTCETVGVTYTNDIKPIYTTYCTNEACHADGSMTTFPMDTYDLSVAAVGFEKIEGAIQHTDGFSPMPKGGDKLADCDIDKILAWIAAGTPE